MEWTNCGGIPLSGLIFVADDVQANGDRRWVCVHRAAVVHSFSWICSTTLDHRGVA
jgi:hypothetical protein